MSHPEFVVKNQVLVPPENISDEEAAELTNIVEVVRKARHNSSADQEEAETPIETSTKDKSSTSGSMAFSSTAPLPERKETKGRLYSVPEGSFFNLATFLPFRLMDANSNAGTRGSDTPQLEDSSVEPSETSRISSEIRRPSGSSYYIFDPASNLAHYLHREADGDEDAGSGYQSYQVPMTIVPLETGGFAYQIGISERDCVAPHRRSEATVRAISIHGQSEESIVNEPSSSSVEHQRALLHDLFDDSNINSRKGIVAKVLEHLRRRHSLQRSDTKADGLNGMYLVGDEDVHDIVETAMQQIRHARQIIDEQKPAYSKVPRSPSKLRLNEAFNIVTPPTATIAEPATTISMPRTSYTTFNPDDKQVQTKVRGSDWGTTTTMVSRKSITEITWAQDPESTSHADGKDSETNKPRMVSESSFRARRASTVESFNRNKSQLNVSVSGFHVTLPNTADLVADVSHAQERKISTGTAITSFPQLLPRSSEEVTRVTPSDLYHHGVDAHSGKSNSPPLVSVEEPIQARPCNHSLFKKNPFHSRSDRSEADTSEMASMMSAKKRQGVGIGSASHQRISSRSGNQRLSADAEAGFLPALIQKIRKSSHKIFHPHHSQKSSDIGNDSTPQTEERQLFPRPEENIMKEQTLPPPKPDDAGIYTAMTGSALVSNRKRGDTCSEDDRPHQCEGDTYKCSGVASLAS
ncbi:Fc.00g038450.m01.CDS01 [Cosmosporella sp. VM-42]